MSYILYILQCSDSTYYTGSTTDLKKRLREHNTLKSGAKYTRARRPVVLKYTEIHASYTDVRKREAEIKRMKRKEKETLWNK